LGGYGADIPNMADLSCTRLPHRALIRLEGPDARSLLNGLLTQEVEHLAEGDLRYGALLTPQGRLVCDLFLLGEAQGVLIDVDASARDALAAKLKLHRLRAKCEITAIDGPVSAAWGPTPASEVSAGDGWIADPRHPRAGWRRYDGVACAAELGDDAYEDHRFALGLPDAVRDGLADKAYASEADLDLLHGVDYQKGCFVGQETTSRMKRRGGIRSRILPLEVAETGVEPGAEVLAGDLRAGEVFATRGRRVLALVRLDRVVSGPLSVEGRPARLDPPDWLPEGSLVAPSQETPA
jgi:hypothetical protein